MVDPIVRNRTSQSSWMNIFNLVIRILLWPIHHILQLIFPPLEYDGLSPAVTSKAAEAFSAYLTEVVPTVSQLPWATMGFVACKDEAIRSTSLLLVYLHSPLHRDADKVAAKFCREEITSILVNPHLIPLGVSIHSSQGAHLAQLLNAVSYPMLAILQPSRGNSLEVVLKIQGPVLVKLSPVALQGHLQNTLQRYETVIAEIEARRIQREEENRLRVEQDAEYEATLEADRQRQQEQEEKKAQLLREQEELEEAVRKEEQAKEDRIEAARNLLQNEPKEGNITQIRFVLPSGRKIVRKFNSDDKVKLLRAFLTLHFHENEMDEMPNIGLSTNYPKKSFNEESDDNLTLQEAGISPQAVLMVQDLDA